MTPVRTNQDTGGNLVSEWLNDAQAAGLGQESATQHRHVRHCWSASLDVHVHTNGAAARILLAAARDVSQSGMAFFCRESLPPFARVTICRAGERVGVAAKVLRAYPKTPAARNVIHAQAKWSKAT